jgi:branched-chain amino acid transport system permease protein
VWLRTDPRPAEEPAQSAVDSVSTSNDLREATARRSARSPYLGLLALVAALAGLAPVTVNDDGLHSSLIIAGTYSICVLSLQWLVGYAGVLSLGHPAMFGLGAYVSSVLTVNHGWSFVPALVVAVAASAVVALLVSPLLRLEGIYFALATLSLVYLFQEGVMILISQTGGVSGLVGVRQLPFVTEDPNSVAYGPYVVVWGIAALLALCSIRLQRTRIGRGLFLMGDDEEIAASLGVQRVQLRIHTWVVSACVAAVGGALYATQVGYLSPEQFSVNQSLIFFAMLVIGGVKSPVGAIIGALIFETVPELFATVSQYREYVFGCILILVVAFAPDGLGSIPRLVQQRLGKRSVS